MRHHHANRSPRTSHYQTYDVNTGKRFKVGLGMRPMIFEVLRVGDKKTIRMPTNGKEKKVRELYIKVKHIHGREPFTNEGMIQVSETWWNKVLRFSDWLTEQGRSHGKLICHYKQLNRYYKHSWMYVHEEDIEELAEFFEEQDPTYWVSLKWWFKVEYEIGEKNQLVRPNHGEVNMHDKFYEQYPKD